ncbi:MAG: hypothetical protein M3R63_18755, partial [Actinomycetota bacterium]|nr:hypothetical protein [Actinomycetota bacterium]
MQDHGTWVTLGEIAHIHANSPGGARYDPSLSRTETDSHRNTLLLCRKHHRIVDNNESAYSAETIRAWKTAHEARFRGIVASQLSAPLAFAPPVAQFHLHRPEARQAIDDAFTRENTVALVGLSGCGKTQIALDYFVRSASSYTFRLWIRAETGATLNSDLAAIAPYIGVQSTSHDSTEALAQRVRNHLDQLPGWLLVVDNAPGPSVYPLLPSSGGHVIVTTQNAGWSGHLRESYRVPPFTNEQAASVLAAAPIEVRVPVMREIVQLTAGHPLAIAQAVSYMAVTGMLPENYLQLLDSRRADLLDRGELPTHATLHASVVAILPRLSHSALQVLDLLASVAPSAIEICPLEPVEGLHLCLPSDELTLEDTLAELRSFSLIEREGPRVVFHELMRDIIRRSLDEGRRIRGLVTALSVVVQHLPERIETADSWPAVETLLPHIFQLVDDLSNIEEFSPSVATFFLNRLAPYFEARGETRQAEEMLTRAYQMLELESVDDLEARRARASVLTNRGM